MAKKDKTRYGPLIIVGVILLGLAGFGTGGLTGNVRAIGTVGDQEIAIRDYQQALNRQIQALSNQFGQQISFQQAQAFGIDQTALQQVVLVATLDDEADALGLSIGDERVLQRLREIPAFQGGSGFNRETYRLTLQQMGETAAEFEADLRDEAGRTLLQAALVSGLPDPEAYAETLVSYIAESRSVTWATVTADDLNGPVPGPTPENIQTYYDANPDAFTAPETRNITYVWLTPDMIIDEVIVSDAAIAELYQSRIADFVVPERRLVERLVYLDQERAQSAADRVASGEADFEDLVVERGLTLSDVDLGDVAPEDLGAAAEAVFAANAGDVVGPISTSMGPALYRMNAVLAAQETTLEEATEELRDELAMDAARQAINDQADSMIDLIAGGATLEVLAERTDMQLGTIAWTPETMDGIAAYDSFRDQAARVAEGDLPELQDLSDGGIFALRLDGITPPTLRPLDEVRDEAAALWQEQRTLEAIIEQAEATAAEILPLTGFDTLGLTPLTEDALTRRSFVEGTPPDFNQAVFDMTVGEVRVLEAGDRAIIVRLEGIAAPDMTDPSVMAQQEAIAANAGAGIAQDVFDAYSGWLSQQADVYLDQATINAVNAQFQ